MTTKRQYASCHHQSYEFDWWRCNEDQYVGRPPSPFPAPFETPRLYRSDSEDITYGIRTLAGTPGLNSNGNEATSGMQNCEGYVDGEDHARRLYWPLCQGPDKEADMGSDLGDDSLDLSLGSKGKKTPKLPAKRPPWCPAKLPNKWGVAGHPPPYTNYCKETLFNTRTANPMKTTIKTTF